MKRDPSSIKLAVLGHNRSQSRRPRRKLSIEELYAMYLTKKSFDQLTSIDKIMAREDLARKVLKYYFSRSWSRGYFQLLGELEDFYDKFPRAGRDKVTFVRFVRSLSVQELKVVLSADPNTLFNAVLWLKRHEYKAKVGGAFGGFYERVLHAVSELRSDKWSKKAVKTIFRLLDEFRSEKRRNENELHFKAGNKELGFYDYFAIFLMKNYHLPAGPAFTGAVLTTRHIVAEYFFDPELNYRSRLKKIREHFKPLFEEYPEAEALLDDYFVRGIIKSLRWQDIVRFTGADIRKLERYYEKNKHRLSSSFKVKLLHATMDWRFLGEDKLRLWWNEHNKVLASITALAVPWL